MLLLSNTLNLRLLRSSCSGSTTECWLHWVINASSICWLCTCLAGHSWKEHAWLVSAPWGNNSAMLWCCTSPKPVGSNSQLRQNEIEAYGSGKDDWAATPSLLHAHNCRFKSVISDLTLSKSAGFPPLACPVRVTHDVACGLCHMKPNSLVARSHAALSANCDLFSVSWSAAQDASDSRVESVYQGTADVMAWGKVFGV